MFSRYRQQQLFPEIISRLVGQHLNLSCKFPKCLTWCTMWAKMKSCDPLKMYRKLALPPGNKVSRRMLPWLSMPLRKERDLRISKLRLLSSPPLIVSIRMTTEFNLKRLKKRHANYSITPYCNKSNSSMSIIMKIRSSKSWSKRQL